jgi:hypothetical protein
LIKARPRPDEIEKLNRKISRGDDAKPRASAMARVLNPAALPEAAGVRVQAEEGEAKSETEQALRRATNRRKG